MGAGRHLDPGRARRVVPGPRAARGGRGGRRRDVRGGALAARAPPRARAPEHAGRDSRRAGALRRSTGSRARPICAPGSPSDGSFVVSAGGQGGRHALVDRPRACSRGPDPGNLGPPEGMPQGHLRLALLRRVAKRVVDVVLDVDLRKPLEDRRLQARGGARREVGLVRRRSGLAPPAPAGRRRRRHGARPRRRDRRPGGGARGRHHRDGPLDRAGHRAHPDGAALGSGRVVRCPGRRERAPPRARRRGRQGVVGNRPARPRPARFSSARARSPATSSESPRSTGSRRRSCCGRDACRTGAPRTRCEVLRLRGRGALPNSPGLRLVQVGTATLRSRQLFGDFLRPTDAATLDATRAPALQRSGRYHRPPPPPLVLAEGRTALERAAPLARTYRTYAWVWPLAAGEPRLWDIDGLVRRSERARVELTDRSSSFAIDAPVEELRAAQQSANVAGRRLLLVGGEGAALLLAFTVLAARGHAARPRRGPAQARLVRRAAVAALAAQRDRERRRSGRRRSRRLARRDPRGRSRRSARRSSRRGRAARERPLEGRAHARAPHRAARRSPRLAHGVATCANRALRRDGLRRGRGAARDGGRARRRRRRRGSARARRGLGAAPPAPARPPRRRSRDRASRESSRCSPAGGAIADAGRSRVGSPPWGLAAARGRPPRRSPS